MSTQWRTRCTAHSRKTVPSVATRDQHMREYSMKKSFVVAASLFAAGTIATAAHGQGIKCGGVNACKFQSACKGARNACRGQNACKGQGWSEKSNSLECNVKGGKVL